MKLMEFRDVERSNPAEIVSYLEKVLKSMENEITGNDFDRYLEEFDNAFEIAQMKSQRSSVGDLSTRGEKREGGFSPSMRNEPSSENRFAENIDRKTEKQIINERRQRQALKESKSEFQRIRELAGLK